MKSLIVIPTYNEKDNIAKLVEAIMGLPYYFSVVIVDDNSPDGTGAVADELSKKFERVKVIHRKGKGGRGSACIEGFQYALKQDVDYIFEMDADLSHDPKEIPEFLKKIQEYDMVIGSRYREGSKIVNWGKWRPIFSRLANFYARSLLNIPITDYTNGYRCYKKHVLADVDFDKIDSSGYIVLSEMAYQIARKGYTIGEIPTVFVNRRRGESNLTLKEILSAFISILRLRIKYRS
jgi:dolichol-phosphate mannosyltransferase